MKLTRNLRHLTAAASLATAAIVIPAVALATPGSTTASSHSAAPQSAVSTRCPRGFLTSWLGLPGSPTAGSSYYQLEISNISGQACTLYGFPGVSAITARGRQIGSAAARNHGYEELRVTLGQYQTAHVVLQITDVGNFSASACKPVTARGLRVYSPGDFTSMVVPFSFRACSRRGPVFLHVSTTIASTGIPGYTQ